MGFKKFSILIIIRTILAIVTLVILTQAFMLQGFHATAVLLAMILVTQLIELIRFVSKTNMELIRFFDAVKHADFSQRFEFKSLGSGFEDLGHAFSEILERIQSIRATQEQKLKHSKAIIERVPVPLISIVHDGSISLWNNSARRLFGSHAITKIDDLVVFGQDFAQQLENMSAGERQLVNVTIDDMEHRLIVSATQIITSQHKETLLSLQDIQSELAVAQLQAWQDLVSVLTHEIMNSITPVASLAKTAVDLIEDVKIQALPEITEELEDILGAVSTVARRSDGLMQFVTSYRRLTRLPVPNKTSIALKNLFQQVQAIATVNWSEKGINLSTHIKPSELDIYADNDMIEQVLINLLQNAEQATTEIDNPQISINAFINLRGHVVIEVADNGHGIDDEIATQIFVPFFTTKKEGSGVGLALTRQVMLAHNGKVAVRKNTAGGSVFSLTF